MKSKACGDALHLAGMVRLSLAAFLTLGAAQSACAQVASAIQADPDARPLWSASDALTAYNDYNTAFYFTPDGTNYDYRTQQGLADPTYFWVAAEQIEIAVDAYDHDPTPARATIITQLCNGFIARYGDNWASDSSYDDDLMWATIAFVRAYKATGGKNLLSDAETNFEVVWNRGYDTTFGGGIYENVAKKPYKASAANWTFVIAGHLLHDATGNATYRRQARTIFGWATTHLYDRGSGRVYDGYSTSGQNDREFSYNYGTAVGAFFLEGDNRAATLTATYLMRNLSGGTYRGVNILPLYDNETSTSDGSGFNGIALRWIGRAYVHGAISNPAVLRWARVNVGRAWELRNSLGLSWNDWTTQTPHGTNLYSWNCSDTVAGMLDIPPDSGGQ